MLKGRIVHLNFLSLIFLLTFSCSSLLWQDNQEGRFPNSDNDKAIERIARACKASPSNLRGLIRDNAKEGEARYLSGGAGFQTFLMRDGRLVIISGVNQRAKSDKKCKFDHLRIDEGPIQGTFAIGRRLFMTIKNHSSGKRRVYVMTAVKNQNSPEPYQVHEMKYNRNSSYAQAYGFKRKKVIINGKGKYAVNILKENGDAYKNRLFRPWEWGNNNENIVKANNGRAKKIQVHDERNKKRISLKRQQRQIVTYLPRIQKNCEIEERISFFFGLFSYTETRSTSCF